ncbi:Hypothetical Protein FCC1311_113762, partial [Hondaea fermentalgiana]
FYGNADDCAHDVWTHVPRPNDRFHGNANVCAHDTWAHVEPCHIDDSHRSANGCAHDVWTHVEPCHIDDSHGNANDCARVSETGSNFTLAPTTLEPTPIPTQSPTPAPMEDVDIVPTQNPTRYKRCSLRRGPDKGCCIKLGKRKFRCCKTYEDVRYCCTGRSKNIPEADQGYEEKFTCCVRYEDDTVECIEEESAKTADDSEPTSEAMSLLQVALSEDDDDDTYYNAYYSDEDYDEGSDADD